MNYIVNGFLKAHQPERKQRKCTTENQWKKIINTTKVIYVAFGGALIYCTRLKNNDNIFACHTTDFEFVSKLKTIRHRAHYIYVNYVCNSSSFALNLRQTHFDLNSNESDLTIKRNEILCFGLCACNMVYLKSLPPHNHLCTVHSQIHTTQQKKLFALDSIIVCACVLCKCLYNSQKSNRNVSMIGLYFESYDWNSCLHYNQEKGICLRFIFYASHSYFFFFIYFHSLQAH